MVGNKTEATLLIKIKQVGTKSLKGIQKGLKGIGSAAGVAKGALGLVAAALTAVSAVALKTVSDFGEFQGVKRAFRNLAQSQGQDANEMLSNMKKLSAGTISNAELMKQANNAMLLGLPIDRMDDMLSIARSAAQATGESMSKMLADITTGLGRGSKLVLDNLGITFKLNDAYKEYADTLGITVSKLSETQKKQAFINKALEVGVRNTKNAGKANLTLKESLDKVTAGLANFSVFVGEAAAPAVQFFAETIGQMFQDSDTAVNQSKLQDFFQNTAKVVTIVKGAFITFGQTVGTTIATVSDTASKFFKLRFSDAIKSAKMGFQIVKEDAVKQAIETGAELNRIDDLYAQARREKAVENEVIKNEALAEIKAEQAEILTAEQEAKIEAELLETEREIAQVGLTELAKLQLKIDFMRQDLVAFKGHAKEKALLQKKIDLEEKNLAQKKKEGEDKIDKEKLSARKAVLSTISSLQNSNNKALAMAGKAAAITQIAIETPVAISKALGAFPPPFNFIAAGLVGVAMASQAANIAGVQLAEGGIVNPTSGGTQATIGEAGRAEAVIPLPDDFDPDEGGGIGGGVTIHFNGPLLADPAQAREFAVRLDEELFKLRKNNESVAFDSGLV